MVSGLFLVSSPFGMRMEEAEATEWNKVSRWSRAGAREGKPNPASIQSLWLDMVYLMSIHILLANASHGPKSKGSGHGSIFHLQWTMHGKGREVRETCEQINVPTISAEAVVLDGNLRGREVLAIWRGRTLPEHDVSPELWGLSGWSRVSKGITTRWSQTSTWELFPRW